MLRRSRWTNSRRSRRWSASSAAARSLPEPTDPERATENGGVLQQLLLLAVEDVEASGDDALDGLWQGGAARALVEQANELLRVQRVAAGTLQQCCLDIGGDRGPVEKRVHELRRLIARERRERERQCIRLATSPVRASREQLRSGSAYDEQRDAA